MCHILKRTRSNSYMRFQEVGIIWSFNVVKALKRFTELAIDNAVAEQKAVRLSHSNSRVNNNARYLIANLISPLVYVGQHHFSS